MIVTVTGNLVAKPKVVFQNQRSGDVYGFSMGENVSIKTKEGFKKHTNWFTGLVSQNKIASILNRIDKGTCVHVTATNAKVETYTFNGEQRTEVKLGNVSTFMAGNLPQVQSQQTTPAAPKMQPAFANETYQAPSPVVQQAAKVPEPPQGWLDQMAEADQHLPF